MKSIVRSVSRVVVTFTVLFVGEALFGQMYQPKTSGPSATPGSQQQPEEAFPSDNPYFRKKASPTPSSSAASSKLSAKDQKFISSASSGGDWEVKTGQLAETKAQSPAVKQLAARLVADHTRLNAALLELAKKKGLSISQGVKAQQISGGNYDQRYVGLVEQDSKEEIAAFSREAQSGNDPDVKAWARKMLPTLEQDLSMAKQASPKQ